MAKRKRVNQRVLILLAALGVLVAVIALAFLVDMFNKLPGSVDKFVTEGDQLYQQSLALRAEGKIDDAVRAARGARSNYRRAIERAQQADYYYKLALAEQEVVKDRTLMPSERAKHFRAIPDLLRSAIHADESHLPARQALCDLYWDYFWQTSTHSRSDVQRVEQAISLFLDEANRLLRREDSQQNHQAFFRRGYARSRLALLQSDDPRWKDQAIEDFETAVRLAPDHDDYRIEYLRFLAEIRDPAAVEATFDRFLQAAPDNVVLRCHYAAHLRQGGRNSEALAQIQEAIRRAPSDPQGHISLASFHEMNRDFPQALSALHEAQRVAPTDPRSYELAARILGRQGDLDAGLAEADRGLEALRSQPQSTTQPGSDANRGRFALNYLRADLLLDKALTLPDPEHRRPLLDDARICHQVLARYPGMAFHYSQIAGKIKFAEGDYQAAMNLLEKAREALGGFMEVDTINLLYTVYMQLGLPAKAEALVQDLMRSPGQDKNPSARLIVARFRLNERNYAEADREVGVALATDPEYKPALDFRAVLQVLLGNATIVPDAAAVNPTFAPHLHAHARQLWSVGRPDDAIRLLLDLYRRFPDQSLVARDLLQWLRQRGATEQADALVAHLRERNPKLADALDFEASVQQIADPQQQFEAYLRWVTQTVEDPLQQALRLADVCLLYGREEEYKSYLDQAATLDANHPSVIEKNFAYALQRRQWPPAEQWAQRARTANADQVSGKLYEAQLLASRAADAQERNLREEARDLYTQARRLLEVDVLTERPNWKEAMGLLGECFLRTDDLTRAEGTYRSILGLDQTYVPALIGMGAVAKLQGNWQEQVNWARKAYTISGERMDPRVLGLYLDAMETKVRLGASTPQEIDHLVQLRERLRARTPRDLPNAARLAWLYEKSQRPGEAEKLYQQVLEMAPDKLPAAQPLLDFYRRRTDRRSELRSLFSRLLESVPDKPAVHILMGRTYATIDPELSRRAFDLAIAANPDAPDGHRAYAEFLAGRGEFDAAVDRLAAYLEHKPDDALAERAMVLYLMESHQPPRRAQALQRVEAMLQRDRTDPYALWLRGLIALREGTPEALEQALDFTTRAVQQAPALWQPRLTLARVYEALGQRSRAKEELDQARRYADVLAIVHEYMDICRQTNDYKAAEDVALEALQRSEDNPAIVRNLMGLYEEWRQWDKLRDLLAGYQGTFSSDLWYWLMKHQLHKSRSETAPALEALRSAMQVATPDQRPSVSLLLVQSLLDNGQTEEALQRVREIDPAGPSAARRHAVEARALRALQQPDRSDARFLDAFRAATGTDGDFVFGQLALALGDSRQATTALAAWAQGPLAESWTALQVLGGRQLLATDYPRAIELLTRSHALAATPEDKAQVGLVLGQAQQLAKNPREAERIYLDVLQQMPRNASALNNLAYLYVEDFNDPAKAEPYALQAYQLQPGRPEVIDTYGWVLARLGKYARAQDYLDQAVTRAPTGALYHFHLGFVFEQTNLPQRAYNMYQEALRLARAQGDSDLATQVQDALGRLEARLGPDPVPSTQPDQE